MSRQTLISHLSSALAIALCLPGLNTVVAQQGPKSANPATIDECETRAKTNVCATWRWNGASYDATWPDGNIGTMTLRLDSPAANGKPAHVTITRIDKAGAMDGMVATYTGELVDNKIVNGAMKWTYYGVTKRGTWSATFVDADWTAPAAAAPTPPVPVAAPQPTPRTIEPKPQPVAVSLPAPVAQSAPPAPVAAVPPPVQPKSLPLPAHNAELVNIDEELARLEADSLRIWEQAKVVLHDCPAAVDQLACVERRAELNHALTRIFLAQTTLLDKKAQLLQHKH